MGRTEGQGRTMGAGGRTEALVCAFCGLSRDGLVFLRGRNLQRWFLLSRLMTERHRQRLVRGDIRVLPL